MKKALGKIGLAASFSLVAVLFAAAPASAEPAPMAQVSVEVVEPAAVAADDTFWSGQRWAGQRWAGQRWAGQRWAGQRWAGTGWS